MDTTFTPPNDTGVSQVTQPPKNIFQVNSVFLLVLGCLVILSILTLAAFLLIPRFLFPIHPQKIFPKVASHPVYSSPKPVSPIFSQIQKRANINDQINISASNKIASGFINPLLLTPSTQAMTLLPPASSSAQQIDPVIFYSFNQTKIHGYDLATNAEYTILDIAQIPHTGYINSNGSSIYNVYYLNSQKKLIFAVQQRTDSDTTEQAFINDTARYRFSIYTYDLIDKEFMQVISVDNLPAGALAAWSDIYISPDEKYAFFDYDNQEPIDPFADVPIASGSAAYTNQPTYFFYNFSDNHLTRLKSQWSIGGPGVARAGWEEDSSSIIMENYLSSPDRAGIFQLYPDGKTTQLVDTTGGETYYFQFAHVTSANKIFYTGTPSVNDNDSVFGYFDLSTHQFTTINPAHEFTLNFIYDFSKGFIYNQYEQVMYNANSGGITNETLDYYDLATGQSHQIANQGLAVLNFNGDYTHLLVAEMGARQFGGSKLYDLDITTGALNYLNTIPLGFSGYDHKVFASPLISPTPMNSTPLQVVTPYDASQSAINSYPSLSPSPIDSFTRTSDVSASTNSAGFKTY